MLDHLSGREGLRDRLRVHETGGRQAPSLEGVRAIVFWLADPLRSYPGCLREAAEIAARAKALRLRIINPPEVLAGLDRSFVCERWARDGLPAPRAIPYETRAGFAAAVAALGPPLLVRSLAAHSRHAAQLLLDAVAVDRALGADPLLPGIAIRYVDVRRTYRRTRPLSIWARLHHRKRAWVVGDRVFPDTLFFSHRPLVGGEVSTFTRQRERRAALRRRLPAGHLRGLVLRAVNWDPDVRRSIRLERKWAVGPAEQREVMLRAARSLGLEWVAIDYSTRADGSAILWEANPYPHFPDARHSTLRAERDVERRMIRKYAVLEEFFLSLLRGAGGDSRGGGI